MRSFPFSLFIVVSIWMCRPIESIAQQPQVDVISEDSGGFGVGHRVSGQGHGYYADGLSKDGFYSQAAGDDGFYSNIAGDDGFFAAGSGDNGFYSLSAGNNGFLSSGAGNNGMSVFNATQHGYFATGVGGDGFMAQNTADYGFHSLTASKDGFFAESAWDDGFYSSNSGDDGFYAEVSGGDGFFSRQSGGSGFMSEDATGNGFKTTGAGIYGVQSIGANFDGVRSENAGANGFSSLNAASDGLASTGAGARAGFFTNDAASINAAVYIAHGDNMKNDLELGETGRIAAYKSLVLYLDRDDNDASKLFVRNGDDVTVATIDESGNADFSGSISKGSGTFKIDHPLEPEEKYLYHSFIESPDMMNIYNGNIETDDNGMATVILPDWFESLNRDFRYQLTAIGSFARLIIKEEVVDNRFVIQSDLPHVKVSWQITGVRQDPYANEHRIEVEVEKEEYNKGRYLHPAVWAKKLNLESLPAVHRENEVVN